MSTKMVRVTSTGTAVNAPARVYGLHYSTTATTGRITLADLGSTGTPLIDLDCATTAGAEHVSIEGAGILFISGIVVTAMDAVAGASIVYDDLS